MTNLSVIILVGKEKIHIRRCLEKLAPLEPRDVFVITSQPDDGTNGVAIEAAKALGWSVRDEADSIVHLQPSPSPVLHIVFHVWPGLYAKQFNWALDNVVGGRLKVEGGRWKVDGGTVDGCSSWILRLDADEYLTEKTIEKLRMRLSSGCAREGTSTTEWGNVAGLTLELKRRFCGGEIRHATNGIRLLRLWRAGRGRSEERSMDEHIAIDGVSDLDELRRLGKVMDFDGAFYDDNLNDMDWWREKHRGYAKREAADALAFARGEVRFKPMKERYYRMPRYLRAFIYFCIRYFLKGGFLDGYAGWMWNFWQGLWYRWIVDREIGKLKGRKVEGLKS